MMLRLAKYSYARIIGPAGKKNYRQTCFLDQKRTINAANLHPDPGTEVAMEKTKRRKDAVDTRDRKPLTNPPFIKNLFLGQFDTRMLIFPEVMDNTQLKDLDDLVQPIQKYFAEGIDLRKIDETGSVPNEVIQKLKDFGLFGQLIPAEYGGLEQNMTQSARLGEIFGFDESIGLLLYASLTLGIKGLVVFGSDEQKAKYLPKVAKGELTPAFCLTEPNSGSDIASIETRARLSDDGKSYVLNGEKSWVTNGDKADVFTVFAKTGFASHTGENVERLTVFLVEKNFGGITCGKPDEKSGVRAANTCSIRFENTSIPIENVLGNFGEGLKIAVSILSDTRCIVGSLCTSVMKKILEPTVAHAIKRKQFGKPLKDFGLIQDKIAHVAMSIYAAESMTYATAALMDSFVHPDASVEAAIVKVFASEMLCQAVRDCMHVIGACAITKEQDFDQHLRSSHAYLLFPTTNEILRLHISLMGLQHAGAELLDSVRKMKDPLNNVGFILRKKFERLKTNRKSPSLEMKLHNHVHPDLSRTGEALELKVIKFQYMVEKYLTTFGDKISEEQFALRRFADIAINFYVCTACLARATRSKSIGLRNHDHEILMARTIAADALTRVDRLLEELDSGMFSNGDDNRVKIAEKVFKRRGYAAEHPLTRNW